LLSKAPGKAQLLIQEMVQGTEVLLGARTDPQYGPFLMVGLGGIFVEVLKDVTIRLLPVSEADAMEMLQELRGYKILQGVRGQPPRDIKALARAMTGLSDLFASHRNILSDFEINPLMVRREGEGAVAVDVRTVKN
jgi:acetyltransferase